MRRTASDSKKLLIVLIAFISICAKGDGACGAIAQSIIEAAAESRAK